jgi:UDP-glucose 4-epimerase
LLTGASGFLGPYVATELTRAGWRVRAALRAPAEVPDETVIVGPIGAATNWTAALTGVDTVVHLAARVHQISRIEKAQRDLYLETNVSGALHLAREAAAAGVQHFVFMSSIAVHGPMTEGRAPFRETDTLVPCNTYAETKAVVEYSLRELAVRSRMAVTVIRPPLIYGRQAKGNFARLVRHISNGLPMPFAAVRNRRAFVAAENVASFVGFRSAGEVKGFEVFIVADDEQVSTAEFIRHIAHALGRRALLFPVPTSLLRRGLQAAQMSEMVASALASLEVDTSKIRATGWRPAVTMPEGLARAISARPSGAF